MFLKVKGDDTYCYTGGKPFNASIPTAVFIHGAQQDHTVWALHAASFANHGFGVLAIDLPGHGRSKGNALTTIEAQAAWLLAALDAAGIQQAILIGHSMGSLIALESAHQAPQRIKKIALLGATFPMHVSEILLDAAKNDEQKAIDMINVWSHHVPFTSSPFAFLLNITRRIKEHFFKPPRVLYTDLLACNSYANGVLAAQSLRNPTLFIFGKQDKMTPLKATINLTNAVSNREIVVIENCGHAMMEEQPDAVLQALHSFLLPHEN